MLTPFSDPSELVEVKTVLLERIRYQARQMFDLDKIELHVSRDKALENLADRLVTSLISHVWSEKLPPKTYKVERVVDCMHYATWVDHLISTIDNSRFSWLTRWVRSHRFENRPKSVTVEVELSPRYVYPNPGFKAAPGVRHYEIRTFDR